MHKQLENNKANRLFSIHISCKVDFRFIPQPNFVPWTLTRKYKL